MRGWEELGAGRGKTVRVRAVLWAAPAEQHPKPDVGGPVKDAARDPMASLSVGQIQFGLRVSENCARKEKGKLLASGGRIPCLRSTLEQIVPKAAHLVPVDFICAMQLPVEARDSHVYCVASKACLSACLVGRHVRGHIRVLLGRQTDGNMRAASGTTRQGGARQATAEGRTHVGPHSLVSQHSSSVSFTTRLLAHSPSWSHSKP